MEGGPVDILLATYNGARYLEAQLDSILGQTDVRWRLVIRDDGSSDATPTVIERFRSAHPDRVRILDPGGRKLGAIGNFAALMAASSSDYAMFCDQDDVWLPEKIACMRKEMHRIEMRYGPTSPLLVHCDLRVVSRDLREIAPSFWCYQDLDTLKGSTLKRLLVQNVITGCAMMMNRPLARLATPIPDGAIMHDWWTALVAAATGRIHALFEPLVLYRQHSANTIGAKHVTLTSSLRETIADPWRKFVMLRDDLRRTQHQAQALAATLGPAMAPAAQRVVAGYAEIAERGALARRLDLLRFGIRFGSHRMNAGLFVVI